MINLFNIEKYTIDTNNFTNILHDKVVEVFENNVCEYVGAKYACGFNSATNAIFLSLLNKDITVNIPSMIPPVVLNAILTSNNKIKFRDDTDWVGDSYVLHDFGDYKIIDSAQKLERDQFKKEANDGDLMIFSFYPTKPVGSIDGGIIVSNDKNKIRYFKEMVLNGMTYSEDNWERVIKHAGYKMYLNSVQAYVGNKNLKKLDEKYKKLKTVREIYNKEFSYSNTSNHLYRIIVDNRNEVINNLKTKGISTGIHYNPTHKEEVYMNGDECVNSDYYGSRTLSIPFHEKLTNAELDKIVKEVKKYV